MANSPQLSHAPDVLQPNLSIYLDVLRYFAALMVYFFHAGHFANYTLPFFGTYGGLGVVVFFVLSGFVIAYSAAGKRRDIVDYFIARFARLWSVVLPAILLTIALDTLGQWLSLPAYAPMQPYSVFKWIASSGISVLFLNQIWHLDIWVGTNGPFWSLSYEFWYYTIFAALIYFRGWQRVVLAGLAVCIAGPSIMVAFPVWFLGVGLYRLLCRRGAAGSKFGAIAFVVSLALLVAYTALGGSRLFSLLPFDYALVNIKPCGINFWPQSYLVGLLIALNIYGFARIQHVFRNPSARFVNVVRTTAETSFGLYLFHYPLMYFCKALLIIAGITEGPTYVVAMYVVPLLAATWLALRCEPLKFVLSTAFKNLRGKRGQLTAQGEAAHRLPDALNGHDYEERIDA
jgi:peptidoglycan/LPS O-acetylase OafA/YrhL